LDAVVLEEFAMAADNHVAANKVPDLLNIGDRVRILHYGGQTGRVVEYRGPFGPGGAHIYGVRIQRKPSSDYIELREDQLELIPADA
jgi:hypothetical protein